MWDRLICEICANLFENPKILPCAHTFCEKCLEGALTKQKSDVRKCPTCRVVVTLYASGVRCIPSNFFLERVLDVMKREMSACCDDSACDACSVSGLRNLRCEDCDMLLCTKCLHAHHDSVLTPANDTKHARPVMEHETETPTDENELEHARSMTTDESVPRENRTQNEVSTRHEIGEHALESTRNGSAFSREHQVHMPLKCRLHRKEDLRFFCSSCVQLVCQDCVISKHITHIFVSVSDAAPSSKGQLNTLLNQTIVRVLYLNEARRDAKDTEEQLRSSVTDITNTLRDPSRLRLGQNPESKQTNHVEEIGKLEQETNASLDEKVRTAFDAQPPLPTQGNTESVEENQGPKSSPQRKDILRNLQTVTRKKFDVLARHRSKLETRLGLLKNCQRFTLNLVMNGSDEEILILENCILETVGELCQHTPELPIECPEDSFIALDWRNDEEPGGTEGTGNMGGMGAGPRIVTGEGSGGCCFATGEGLSNAVVGEECAFTVTVKDEKNQPCLEGVNSIVARIKTPSGGYFKAALVEHKLGKHKFRYRTYSAGPHVLRITLRGEEILGSPFEALGSGSTDYSRRGRLVRKFGRSGSGDGELCQPQGLAVDRLSRIFVADTGNHRVQVFDETGRFLFAFGWKGSEMGEFNAPCDVTIAKTGHVIVADKLNDRLQLFTPDGEFVRQMRCGMVQPIAVTTDQYRNIVVVDSDHTRVLVFTMSGERLRSITRRSSGKARLENVQGVACNQTGETFLVSRIPARNPGVTAAMGQTQHASLVQVFDNNGTYIREFTTPSYTRLKPNCCRLVTDYDDRVLATGSGNKVQVFTRVGGHLTNISFTEKDCSQIDISAIALSPNEAVVVADAVNGRILVF